MLSEFKKYMLIVATNAPIVTTKAAMTAAKTASINWTVILSLVAVCLTAMTVLIKIFSTKQMGEKELPSEENLFCKQKALQISGAKEKSDSNEKDIKEAKEILNKITIEVEKLKIEQENTNKTLSEIKQDNKELAQRLEDLLHQLMEWMSE